MKRTLSASNKDDEPPTKRHKTSTATLTPPLSDIEDSEKAVSDEDNECCICLNKIDLPIMLDCGHSFCFLCLKEIRMQSSSTFNLATFDCNDPNNNHSGNSEKFCCPYCRKEFDVKVIDRAKMDKTEWMKAKKKNDGDDMEEIVIWQYSGRSGGYWCYQETHNKEIENGYKTFLKQLKNEQEKECKEQQIMNGPKYGLNIKNENEKEDDLGKEDDLLSHQIIIEIGIRQYVVDFAQMIQYDLECPTRKRKIRRNVETKHSLERSDSLKGCAGKYFDKKKENEHI